MKPNRKGSWLQTFSGIQFWPLDPKPDEIEIKDIAHALSMLCRFNGHGKKFYSVAEHSVLVSAIVSNENKIWGLLHDSAEAYISDVPQPVKKEITDFHNIEEGLLRCIGQKFNLPQKIPKEIFQADMILLATEKKALMGPEPAPWDSLPEALDPSIIKCLSPWEAKEQFLDTFHGLIQHLFID